ncbi:MAG: hypothetical protein ABIP55_07520 [Tepidisphaeraceae bacterium]
MRTPILSSIALTAAALIAPAHAEDDAGPAAASAEAAATLATPAQAPRLNPLHGKLLDNKALSRRRGGTDIVSDQKLSGVVADNRAINVTSGANLVSEGAFTNASGLPVVIQNSGSNVLIQNATIVNVQVH